MVNSALLTERDIAARGHVRASTTSLELKRLQKEIETHLGQKIRVFYTSGVFTLEIYQDDAWDPVLILDTNSSFPEERLGRCWDWLPYARFSFTEKLLQLN